MVISTLAVRLNGSGPKRLSLKTFVTSAAGELYLYLFIIMRFFSPQYHIVLPGLLFSE
jgi:hypothetical protein